MTHNFCLDPSCFTSPKRLAGLHKILNELKNQAHGSMSVYIPTQLYEVLMLQPDEKFPKLKKLIRNWIGPFEFGFWNQTHYESDEYVFLVRQLFQNYDIQPTRLVVGDIKKLGEHSIFRDDVVKNLGQIGHMIFDLMAVSSELVKARIIGFSQKTISLISKIGVPIVIAPSKLKKRIKQNAGISWLLLISSFLTTTHGVSEFFSDYEIEHLPLTLAEIGSLGLLVVADGSKQ